MSYTITYVTWKSSCMTSLPMSRTSQMICVHFFSIWFAYSGSFQWIKTFYMLYSMLDSRAHTDNAYISNTHDTVFISETKVICSPNCTHHPDSSSLSEASVPDPSFSASSASLGLPISNFFPSVNCRHFKSVVFFSPCPCHQNLMMPCHQNSDVMWHHKRCYDVTYDIK